MGKALRAWVGACVMAVCGLAATEARGQALAVSTDGSAIYSAGVNRVVYRIDPATLKVTERIRVNQPVLGVATNADGSLLYVVDGVFEGKLTIRNTKTGAVVRTVEKVNGFGGWGGKQTTLLRSGDGNVIAYREGGKVVFLSAKDGKETGRFDLPKDTLCAAALNKDGTTLALVTVSLPNEETKAERATGNDLEAAEKTGKSDGKGSTVYLINVADGKETAKLPLWYSADGYMSSIAGFAGEDVVIMTYGNVNARVTPKGEIKLFKHTDSLGYGMGISGDGTKAAAGSMIEKGVLVNLGDMKKENIQGTKALPGWPEYWEAIAFDGKRNMYGTTSSLRIFKLDEKLAITVIEPVY